MNYSTKLCLVIIISVFVLTLYLPQVHATVGTIATTDTNYFVEDANINIRGTGFSGTDLNVGFRIWDPVADRNYWSGADFNIIDNNSSSSTICDQNIFALQAPATKRDVNGLNADYNGAYVQVNGCAQSPSFDVNAQIPLGITKGLAYIYAHTFTSPSISTTSFSTPQTVYITPFLQILGLGGTAGNRFLNRINRAYVPEDVNIMIRGIGFPIDSNVSFKIVSGSTTIDLNITDDGNGTAFSTAVCNVNSTCDGNLGTGIVRDFQSARATAFGDGNYVTVDQNFVPQGLTGNGVTTNDFNGWGYYRNGPDGTTRTGGFDVNILVPRNVSFLNTTNIDFNVNTKVIDLVRFTQVDMKSKLVTGVDANFINIPKIVSMNVPATVKVLSGSTWIDENRAFPDGNITNFQAVKFWIQSNDFNVVTNGSDINMLKGGEIKTYDGNILTADGVATILSTSGKMSEFSTLDANITFLNARSTGTMPTITRDKNGLSVNYICPTPICTNADGSTLSSGGTDAYGNLTWTYNSTALDGNLF